MKKIFTLVVSCLLMGILTTGNLKAQNQMYWSEGFEPGTSAALVTTAPAVGPAAPYFATIGSGTWYIYGCYRTTGTACANGTYTDGSHPMGSNHLRLSKNIAPDSGYVITPPVDYGIKELHFLRSQASRKFNIYMTADTGALVNGPSNTPTNWVLVTATPNSPTVCQDTTILINSSTAKRLKIEQGKANLDYNIDSVFITSFSFIPVPVSFTSINLVSTNGIVKLSWDIQTEINTDHYVIERSSDGRHFSAAGLLAATNSSKYVWIDNTPLQGTSYYRVKGLENGAAVKYSTAVRYSNSPTRIPQIIAAPNPIRGSQLTLQLNNLEKGTYMLSIYNAAGQKLVTSALTHEGGISSKSMILPASVSPGIYNLQVANAVSRYTTTIVVQ